MGAGETSTLDIMRFDEDGERVSWRSVQMGSTTQTAPFEVHGRFAAGEEVWCSHLVYADGVALLSVERPPSFDPDGSRGTASRPVFLIYPSKAAARAAGW